jgi:hypothetical protein
VPDEETSQLTATAQDRLRRGFQSLVVDRLVSAVGFATPFITWPTTRKSWQGIADIEVPNEASSSPLAAAASRESSVSGRSQSRNAITGPATTGAIALATTRLPRRPGNVDKRPASGRHL